MKGIISLVVAAIIFHNGSATYKRVCYFTNWSQYRPSTGKFLPDKIEPSLCTHIIYAFGKLMENKLVNYEWNDDVLYESINSLKVINPNLKILLAAGGWNAGSVDFSNMAATVDTRKYFITSTISWIRKHNFDGFDIDWEYPARRGGRTEDYNNYATLVKEFREAFENEAVTMTTDCLLLTASVAAGKSNIDGVYDVPEISKYLDFISLMTYDFHVGSEPVTGHNSPLFASAADIDKTLNMAYAAYYWHKLGAPKEKLIIGLATYGRSFLLSDPNNYYVRAPSRGPGPMGNFTRENGYFSYYEICLRLKMDKGKIYRDNEAKVPYYVEGDLWISYDDEQSIYEKVTQLIIKEQYGGAMIWALPLDDFSGICGGTYPLINTMKDALFAAENGNTSMPPVDIPQINTSITPVTDIHSSETSTAFNCRDALERTYSFVGDCTKYIECVGEMKYIRTCPSGLHFNSYAGLCDWPEIAECSNSNSSTGEVKQNTTNLQNESAFNRVQQRPPSLCIFLLFVLTVFNLSNNLIN